MSKTTENDITFRALSDQEIGVYQFGNHVGVLRGGYFWWFFTPMPSTTVNLTANDLITIADNIKSLNK